MEITEDGFLSLLTATGTTKDDLKMPTDAELAQQIQTMYDDGKEVVVSVLCAMGIEGIVAVKEAAASK